MSFYLCLLHLCPRLSSVLYQHTPWLRAEDSSSHQEQTPPHHQEALSIRRPQRRRRGAGLTCGGVPVHTGTADSFTKPAVMCCEHLSIRSLTARLDSHCRRSVCVTPLWWWRWWTGRQGKMTTWSVWPTNINLIWSMRAPEMPTDYTM